MKIEKKFMNMFSKDCCAPKLFFFKTASVAFYTTAWFFVKHLKIK